MAKHEGFQSKFSKTLEDQFFYQQDQILMEEFRRMQQMKETKETLARVSGITNDEILEKLVALNVRPEIVASLAMVPLIEVAWADGKMDEEEKAAILNAAEKSFFAKNSIDMKLLAQWLEHLPARSLLDAWAHYMEGLCQALSAAEKEELKKELIGHARQIAEAAGGFLGLGSKISAAEWRMLEYLESAFD